MGKSVNIKMFGRTVTVTFAEESYEVYAELTVAELREAAKQHIIDEIWSLGETQTSALVRVTNIED